MAAGAILARMTLVAVPLAESTPAALVERAARARELGAEAIELRLDRCILGGGSAEELIAAIPRLGLPAILTCRHASEGGAWSGDASERERLFDAADRAGAGWIDIELAHLAAWRPAKARLIISAHDFHGMGEDPEAQVRRMLAAGAHIAKIALTARDGCDLERVRALNAIARGMVAAMAMGEHGLASRLLAGVWGSALCFARLDSDGGSAPGQPLLSELARYRVRAQGERTQVYGVIGSPVAHSLSPLVHNAAFAHHRLDAVYVPFRVEDAGAFWSACGGWIEGLSITIPHKQALLEAVDEYEPEAKALGAINTIYRSDTGATVGANTDAPAMVRCLEMAAGTLKGRKVLVLGAGGVARAAAMCVRDRGATVAIANRTAERGRELSSELGVAQVPWERAADERFDILINGTSVGMGKEGKDASPWPAQAHRARSVVFDTVYTPIETRLLRDAQAAGATTVCGLDMFIAQAVGQFERWTALEAPEHLMYRIALERLDPAGVTAVHRRRSTAGPSQ